MTGLHLVQDGQKPVVGAELTDLPLDQLTMGDDIRLDDDVADLAGLAESIRQLGVLEPLLVQRKGDGWEIIAGRRRCAASRLAGLSVVPCIVRQMAADEAFDATLAENLHRRPLSPIEEALAYKRMSDRGLKQVQIAKRVGRSQVHVSRLLQLLKLPEATQVAVHKGELAVATALRSRERTGKSQGGKQDQTQRSGDLSEVAQHWRRRHDRLLAGLRALQRAKVQNVGDFRELVGRVIRLDTKPLD